VKVRGIAGSTDLGDGKATLVLDLLNLMPIAGHGGAP
jgi:chemotaxis protein histidine kinase CheA